MDGEDRDTDEQDALEMGDELQAIELKNAYEDECEKDWRERDELQ